MSKIVFEFAPMNEPASTKRMDTGRFSVPVEAGQILQFARAIGDPNPVYVDVANSRAKGFRDVLAPPTFLMVADHFDPFFERRPMLDRANEYDALLHVEQRFVYHRHVTAGEVLSACRLLPRSWEKQGRRAGRLEFIETITEFLDAAGDLVVSTAWVDVRTDRSHAALSTSQDTQRRSSVDDGDIPFTETVLVEKLTRTQIVMYVGASGDFHPLHHDGVYARDHGYPGVFAPGMLTMALTARAITDHVGDGVLAQLKCIFRAQVWPGDTLIARLRRVADQEVRVETINQSGVAVLHTEAIVR